MTNFYPVCVYASNFKLYSSLEKANFQKQYSRNIYKVFAVLNLKELKSMRMDRFIYDIDIDKFETLEDATEDCKDLMKNQ